jgi:hypothetical protein
MIVKNITSGPATTKRDITFIANGEIVQGLRVRNDHIYTGFRFATFTDRFQDYDMERISRFC